MRAALLLFLASALAVSPASSRAEDAVGLPNALDHASRPGLSASVFSALADGAPSDGLRLGERLAYHGTPLERPKAFFTQGSGGSAPAPARSVSWSGRNTALAVLASAVLPGMGELYCWSATRERGTLARASVFVALDGVMWYGYFHNHGIGKDYKRDYEDYADIHWDLDRFLHNHPCCNQGVGDSCDSWQYFNEHCQGQANYFYYTPRELDTEEYYENIGKYDAFVFGWDDAAAWDYDNADEFKDYQYWTPHRTAYWDLRKDSDRYLLRGDQYLMGLLVSRVVSMLDAAWIAHRISSGQDPNKGWSLEMDTFDEEPSLIVSRRF
jgi:hypothetical protein